MKYTWTRHAASERLPERSGLSQAEVEELLNQHKYVVLSRNEEHHLIWDHVKGHLIDIPLLADGTIPTVLPVDYGSGYTEWRRAEAEMAWRGESFFKQPVSTGSQMLDMVEVVFSVRPRQTRVGYQDLFEVMSWRVLDEETDRSGDIGMLTLLRDKSFCTSVKSTILQWDGQILSVQSGDTLLMHIKKRGAHRLIPTKFFLSIA